MLNIKTTITINNFGTAVSSFHVQQNQFIPTNRTSLWVQVPTNTNANLTFMHSLILSYSQHHDGVPHLPRKTSPFILNPFVSTLSCLPEWIWLSHPVRKARHSVGASGLKAPFVFSGSDNHSISLSLFIYCA